MASGISILYPVGASNAPAGNYGPATAVIAPPGLPRANGILVGSVWGTAQGGSGSGAPPGTVLGPLLITGANLNPGALS